jgi:hypothetical protein
VYIQNIILDIVSTIVETVLVVYFYFKGEKADKEAGKKKGGMVKTDASTIYEYVEIHKGEAFHVHTKYCVALRSIYLCLIFG